MYKNIKYFKGLNALRFFAAYLVVLQHAEQIRWKNELFSLKAFSFFSNGGIAVNFFFVLSGFLISYLLLKEIKQTDNVSIGQFYTRRVLRIWPLYFLLVFIGTILIPVLLGIIGHPYEMPYSFKDVILYYVFFAPFMVNILFGHHLLEPLWSIGVEEIFYIFWAPLFKFFKRHLPIVIGSVIVVSLTAQILANVLDLSAELTRAIQMLRFESMAIGGLTAFVIYHRKKELESNVLFSIPAQIAILTFIILRLGAHQALTESSVVFDILFNTPVVSDVLLTCSFAWLIVNVSINKRSLVNLDHKVFNFLGDISYGIYMYHMLVVFGIILILKNYLASMSDVTATVFFYVALTAIVLLVSYLSKKFFEDFFLSLKGKFRTGNKAVKAKS